MFEKKIQYTCIYLSSCPPRKGFAVLRNAFRTERHSLVSAHLRKEIQTKLF